MADHSLRHAQGRVHVLHSHLVASVAREGNKRCLSPSKCEAAFAHNSKVCSAAEAVELVPGDANITIGGFVGCGLPEALVNALRERFDATGCPKNLHLYMVAAVGDGKGRGMDRLAVEGLVTRYTYAWTGLSPGFLKLVRAGKVAAWNLPLGVVSHIIRDVAAARPGPITRIGLGTFVDPREGGGRIGGSPDQPAAVEVVSLGGRDFLWYRAPAAGIQVALVRGTTADLDGNISFEREPLFLDQLNQAMAAHNSGGKVIVQVERLVERGSLPARAVHLPGAIVDKVVVAQPALHWQTMAGPGHEGALTGEVRMPSGHIAPLPLSERRIIGHRAMLEITASGSIVNLGIGVPEAVARMVWSHGQRDIPSAWPITLSTEAGALGGAPAGGPRFGAAYNADAVLPCATMLDFYNGGGVDVACLGMAEVDEEGNVNVSNFPGRQPGCGGFIDISQSAKKVIFCGSFTSGGLKVRVSPEGSLAIEREGRARKFCRKVREKTFAAATAGGRPILYVTERAVFRLRAGRGIELVEKAPGMDLERDILAHMDFVPIMGNVKSMDPRVLQA